MIETQYLIISADHKCRVRRFLGSGVKPGEVAVRLKIKFPDRRSVIVSDVQIEIPELEVPEVTVMDSGGN